MHRTIVTHFYCLRHGHPATEEGGLDSLGYEQIRATVAAHLRDVRLHFAASSDERRAQATLVVVSSYSRHRLSTYHGQQRIGYKWLLGNSRLPKWKRPDPKPTNASELVERWTPASTLGQAMWERIIAITKAELWLSFHDKAERKVGHEYNALVVGHGGVIEAMATVAANQGVPLATIPMLSHADILRYTVQWAVDGGEFSDPKIIDITHLPCPIRTPA